MKNPFNIFPGNVFSNKNIFEKSGSSFIKTNTAELNLWFIRLRWIACIVAFLLVIVAVFILKYLSYALLFPLLALVIILSATNLLYLYSHKKKFFADKLAQIQILADLIILTLMLHFSGGVENPLIFLYIFHIILSGILLEKKDCYKFVAISIILFLFLAFCELYDFIPHYTFDIFPHEEELTHEIHASHYQPFVWSLTLLQIILLSLTAVFITNIMSKLRREEQISLSERLKLKSVLDVTSTGFIIFDNNLNPVWFNEPVKEMLIGAEINKIDDYSHLKIWTGEHINVLEKTLNDSRIRFFEKETVDSSGHQQFFLITVASINSPDNKKPQIVELIQNITEKKTIEMELIQSSKMATLGTISAGIAHEVGNPLSSISTRLELLKSNDDFEFKKKSILILQNEINRIEKIVRGISEFGRRSKENWKFCNINQLVIEAVEILNYHKEAKNLKINLQLEQNLPGTIAVHDQLRQVFLNLGLNASESMSSITDPTLTIKSYSEPGKIILEFIDKGVGIKKENIEKIFNPFWTSKENGLGLGMFIVSQIIQAHGGSISTESELEKGAKFIIKLPRRLKKE